MSFIYKLKNPNFNQTRGGTYMSDFVQAVNTGSAFKNKYKKDSKHPDFKGEFNNNGNIVDVAIWRNKTKSGEDYLFFKVSEKYNKDKATPVNSTPPPVGADGKAMPW